jgi:hypothetical protein
VSKNGSKGVPQRTKQRSFLTTKQITVLEHSAYSPDRTKMIFFPKIKGILKGTHCDDIDDIRSNTMAALKSIPQN